MGELAELFLAYQAVPPGHAAGGRAVAAPARRALALALDAPADAKAPPACALSAEGWARLLEDCGLRSKYIAPPAAATTTATATSATTTTTTTAHRGEATGAALDFPSFVAAVARTAFAHANPRYEASGLYAIPPWPLTCAAGGQRVEAAYSANVQGLVQLPEAFHLLMRHTLG